MYREHNVLLKKFKKILLMAHKYILSAKNGFLQNNTNDIKRLSSHVKFRYDALRESLHKINDKIKNERLLIMPFCNRWSKLTFKEKLQCFIIEKHSNEMKLANILMGETINISADFDHLSKNINKLTMKYFEVKRTNKIGIPDAEEHFEFLFDEFRLINMLNRIYKFLGRISNIIQLDNEDKEEYISIILTIKKRPNSLLKSQFLSEEKK